MAKSFEEWAKTADDPGMLDYLAYLSEFIEQRAAEIVKAKTIYIKHCKEEGIDIPMQIYTGPFVGPED